MKNTNEAMNLLLSNLSLDMKKNVTQIFNSFTIKQSFIDQIVNLTPSLITVYNTQTGEYIFINKALEAILGYSVEEWMKKGASYIAKLVHPEDLPRIMMENQQAIDKENSRPKNKNTTIKEFEYRIKHIDGSYRWLRTYGAVFDRDDKGKVRNVINISLDVTAIKESEEKLLRLTDELEQKVDERTKELEEGVKKFQVLIENSTDAIVLVNRLGKMLYASPGTEKVLGYTPQEMLAIKNPSKLIHKDDKGAVFKLFAIHFKKPADKLITRFRVLNKKDEYAWIEVIATNLINEPSIGAIVLNFRDITNQVKSEERQQEEIKNAALRININDAMSHRHDLGTTMDLCVNAVVNKLGASLAKIWVYDEETESIHLLARAASKHLKDFDRNIPLWSRVNDGRIAFEKKSYLTNNVENDPEIKDKAWVRKNNLKSFAGYPLVLDDKLVGVMTLFSQHEISPRTHETLHLVADSIAQGIGRKQAREALSESERKYHTIFSTLAEGVVLQDTKGKIIAANSSAERILELNFDQLKKKSASGKTSRKYLHEDNSELLPSEFPFLKAIQTGQAQKNKIMGIVRENKTSWLLVNSVPLKDDLGLTYAVASSFQDITEQKRLEKQKDEFISIASHELKTPLTTIKSFTEILKMQFTQEERAQHYLNKMNGEIDRLTELVNDLLDVSKIHSGRLTLVKDVVDISKFIKEVIEDIQTSSTTHKIILKKNLRAKVAIDKFRMYQVLINLISNAIKYSPKSDKVLIYIEKDENDLIFKVKDFGIGITQRDQERIFEPFFQASTTIRQSHSGLGLGLHIVKEIITRHGGSISATSEKGKGTTFTFSIPIEGG